MAIDANPATHDAVDPKVTTRQQRAEQFDRVFAANRAALARLTASYARTAADRDDLLQEIGIALWRALPRFRGDCSERTFLFRIAHNRCITHAMRRRETVSLDDAGLPDERIGTAAAAEAEAAEEQERRRLLEAIRRLPVIYREVTVLVLEGLEYKEIADVVGISETNVGVRLNRARRKLQLMLGEGS
jgi:RNA polymerase sigma-70 factor (ECF subfamily)